MKKYTGILEDSRSKKLQEKNYDSREVSLGAIKWLTKKKAVKNATAYIKRNQYSKSSCVPSSIANALWNTEKKIFADEPWYTTRINKPQEGCYWYDMADKAVKSAYLRKDCPEVKTEALANAYKIPTGSEKKEYAQTSYIFFQDPSIDEIVKFINSGYSVPFSFFSNSKEWSQEYPEVQDKDLTIAKASINHAVCAIPYTGYIEKGAKYFIISDSAHFGKIDTRHVSSTFTDIRAKHGIVFTDLITEVTNDFPKGHQFTKDLFVGSNSEDVRMLQVFLKSEGFFPSNITATGYYGGITRQAVKDYQEAYKTDILIKLGLKSGTGYFGKSTRAFVNKFINL